MSRRSIVANSDISEEQIKKIEALYKQRNRLQQKKSMQKRGSIKLRHLRRDSGNFNKEQLNLLETLAMYFQNVEKYIQQIDEFCEKRRIYFLKDLKRKVTHQQYKSFMANLQLYKVSEGCKLQQQGKFHNFHYIFVDGCIGAYQQKKLKDDEKQYVQKFEYQTGEAIISNLLQTHKSNPYTNKVKRLSILLRFTDDIYNKYLKKLYLRDCDENASILSHTLVFRAIPLSQLKKFIPYCNVRRFRYNEIIYEQDEPIRQLFLILEGEAEIGYEKEEKFKNKESKESLVPLVPPNHYKLNYQATEKKEIKIVRVGNKELFGLQAYEVFNQNYYQHHARATSDQLKILAISLDVLYEIELQNPILQENLNYYLKKTNAVHNKLLMKSQNLTIAPPQKKKKRKRKIKRRTQISLEWWGLAAKIQDTKKYKLPTPPKNTSEKNLRRKQPLVFVQRTSKLEYFKKRLFEDQIEGLQQVQQKENNELLHSPGLVPKLQKVKIKMINSKPKVINNAERVKKKLLDYAKNKEIFCDRLQLQ